MMNRADTNYRHPLTEWLLLQYPWSPISASDAENSHDIGTIAGRLGAPQTGKDAAKVNRAYRIVAEDLLRCAEASGDLVRDKDGWWVLNRY